MEFPIFFFLSLFLIWLDGWLSDRIRPIDYFQECLDFSRNFINNVIRERNFDENDNMVLFQNYRHHDHRLLDVLSLITIICMVLEFNDLLESLAIAELSFWRKMKRQFGYEMDFIPKSCSIRDHIANIGETLLYCWPVDRYNILWLINRKKLFGMN